MLMPMTGSYPNYLVVVLALFGAVIACGCMAAGGEDGTADRISGNGTVTYVDLEGGFYGIVADDGERYLPADLPAEYRQDGLRVRFVVDVMKDTATIQMWGTPVEIVDIPWACARCGGDAGIANPAAVWCTEQGHTYEIRKNPDGSEYGVCIFANGTEVDAWDYYRRTH